MSFLPEGYKSPDKSSQFMKFEEGANKFRILSKPVIGWEGWKDNKPFRRKGIDQNINATEVDMDEKYKKPKISYFWAFVVWNYKEEKCMTLSITQKKIRAAIEDLDCDPEWGDVLSYDLTITKTKTGGKTEYSVKPHKPTTLKKEITEAYETANIDLEKLFDGGYPQDESEKDYDNMTEATEKF